MIRLCKNCSSIEFTEEQIKKLRLEGEWICGECRTPVCAYCESRIAKALNEQCSNCCEPI